ncbi:hypothetical protein Tco_0755709 [Tanacetum coccineum]
MFKDNSSKKTVHISEWSNEERVKGADVAILLAAIDEVAATTQVSDDGYVEVTRKHGKGKQTEIKEAASQIMSNAFSALKEDNGKPTDDLVDDPQKKGVHYFDRDDMEFDDMGHAIEEVEHEIAYSENG